jgi:ketol-acid reductoisomerase
MTSSRAASPATGWLECASGARPSFKATRRNNDAHQIEQVGEKLRGMMPWITAGKMVDKAKN